jgi:hypothetical protein
MKKRNPRLPFAKVDPEGVSTAFGNVCEHIEGEIRYFESEEDEEAVKAMQILYQEIDKAWRASRGAN